jgi:hypothetical protein
MFTRLLGGRLSRAELGVVRPAEAEASSATDNPRQKKKPSSRERDMRRDQIFMDFFEKCAPNSMTTMERLYGVYTSIEYIVRNSLPGDIAECGVWRGGSMMMAALSLRHFGDTTDRRLFLFDTFEGMPAPTDADFKFDGMRAEEKWTDLKQGLGSDWNNAPFDLVKDAMASTGYAPDKIVLIKGRVEETLPVQAPERLAMLRLDTDFYSSTKHELNHLFPRLVAGGVLIIDDYGTGAGSQRAVTEYFIEQRTPMLLNRLDAAGRIGVKPR